MSHDHSRHRANDHDHDHGHDHAHGAHHHHEHHHAPRSSASYGRAFAVGISLNVVFIVVEVFYGIASGSIALVSDATHNLTDVLGLALAWAAFLLARRKPSRRRTYGFRKTTVLAALVNAVLLLVAVGGVAWEAIGRLSQRGPIDARVVMWVAAFGVLVNGASALFFLRGREDANLKGAFLHLASDAAVSLGVVVSAFVILRTGWTWLDPVISLVVSLVILASTWGLLRHSVDLALDAVPGGIDPHAVERYLADLPGVLEVHDLHIWAMSTTETAMTAHLVMATDACHATFLRDVGAALHQRFKIEHSTVQVEPPESPEPCRLAADEAV
jgi:cobalt-zinc-cadmium efflux system protein